MNLYLLKQTQYDDSTHSEVCDGVVVAAETEKEARNITPTGESWEENPEHWCKDISYVNATLLGMAKEGTKAGLILASFNDA